jgi:hypothetical protein
MVLEASCFGATASVRERIWPGVFIIGDNGPPTVIGGTARRSWGDQCLR